MSEVPLYSLQGNQGTPLCAQHTPSSATWQELQRRAEALVGETNEEEEFVFRNHLECAVERTNDFFLIKVPPPFSQTSHSLGHIEFRDSLEVAQRGNRVTWLIKSIPSVETYSSPMPRDLW